MSFKQIGIPARKVIAEAVAAAHADKLRNKLNGPASGGHTDPMQVVMTGTGIKDRGALTPRQGGAPREDTGTRELRLIVCNDGARVFTPSRNRGASPAPARAPSLHVVGGRHSTLSGSF